MIPNPHKTAIRFLTALLKHQAETWLGKDATGIASEILIDEELQKRIDDWLLNEETAKRLLEASSKADEYFAQQCDDNELKQALSLGLGNLPSVQAVLARLPNAMGFEAVRQVLQAALTRDFPRLSKEQCEYGAEVYTDALLRAVSGIEKFTLPILVQGVLDLKRNQNTADKKLDTILAHLESRNLLQAFYVSPEDVFKRVRVEDFIGRKWLVGKIDEFLHDPNRKSGAFLIEGKAGVGKSAFMAYLVKTRGYFHLFGEQFRGDSNVIYAVKSLASQLIAHFNLSRYKNIDLEKLADSPNFLQGIFNEAAQKLTAREKIVIVCDALDEAGNSADGRVFGLPNSLPEGVYLIISKRPVPVKLPDYDKYVQPFNAESDENLKDVEAFLQSVAKRKEVASQLAEKRISDVTFIQTLKDKSMGVWIYLYYVLDIKNGYLLPLNLETMPLGLGGYYQRYWSEWRNGTRGKGEEYWDSIYAPLLATLAAVQQPISVKQLIAWADIKAKTYEVIRLLQESWGAFIIERVENDESGHKQRLYFPYHLSFQDFFTQTKFTGLSESEGNFARELAEMTTEAHLRIVADFQVKCNGKWEELVSKRYPRQHLSTHLALGGDYKTLRRLLTEGDEYIAWAETKYQAEDGIYAGYLADLQHLWNHAIDKNDYALLIRLMLIENSIHSLVSKISLELLLELAKAKLWSPSRCIHVLQQYEVNIRHNNLDYTRDDTLTDVIVLLASLTISDTYQQKILLNIIPKFANPPARARALAKIVPYLNDELKAQVLNEALTIAREDGKIDPYDRTIVLIELAPHLNDELKAQALTIAREIGLDMGEIILAEIAPFLGDEIKALTTAREIEYPYYRAKTLAKLAPRFNDELKAQVLDEALTIAREIDDQYYRAKALAELAPHLNDELKSQVLDKALIAARKTESPHFRAEALAELAPHLNDELKSQALTIAREIDDPDDRAKVLAELAPHLNDELKSQALTIAREIDDPDDRAKALAELAPHLNDELKSQVLDEVLTIAREIEYPYSRAKALAELAPHLKDELKTQVLDEALIAARKKEFTDSRSKALAELAPYISDELKIQILQESLSIARKIDDDYQRATILKTLVPRLNDDLKSQALTIAREFDEPYDRAMVLAELVPHLNGELKTQALDEALTIARELEYPPSRATVLAELVPHLNGELKTQALDEALTIVREFDAPHHIYERPEIVAKLVPHLNDELKAQFPIRREINSDALLAELGLTDEFNADKLARKSKHIIALASIGAHLDDNNKTHALEEKLFFVDIADTHEILKTWQEVRHKGLEKHLANYIRYTAQKERNKGLSALNELIPALIYFAGKDIVSDVLRAVHDTAHWWP